MLTNTSAGKAGEMGPMLFQWRDRLQIQLYSMVIYSSVFGGLYVQTDYFLLERHFFYYKEPGALVPDNGVHCIQLIKILFIYQQRLRTWVCSYWDGCEVTKHSALRSNLVNLNEISSRCWEQPKKHHRRGNLNTSWIDGTCCLMQETVIWSQDMGKKQG